MTGSTEKTPSTWSSTLGPVRSCAHAQHCYISADASQKTCHSLQSQGLLHARGGTCACLRSAAAVHSCRCT